MKRWLGVLLVATGAFGQVVQPMAKEAKPVFEVAAIKRTAPGDRHQGYNVEGSRVVLRRQSVTSMLMFSYGLNYRQVVGGPEWMGTETYDVNGTADAAGEPDSAQMQSMVRALLADRFGLKFHREKQMMGYFALRVASGGPKMAKEANPLAADDNDGSGGPGGMTMKFVSSSMANFIVAMQYFVDRPVLNETGLAGRYDFELKWSPDTMKAGEVSEYPGLTGAMREQLGLKLESAKGPVEVMVVDGLERPSGN